MLLIGDGTVWIEHFLTRTELPLLRIECLEIENKQFGLRIQRFRLRCEWSFASTWNSDIQTLSAFMYL